MRYLIILAVLMAQPTHSLLAQYAGAPGSYARLGFSARGMAMGNVLSSISDEGIYTYYNPALAAEAHQIEVDAFSALMPFDRQLNMVGASFKLPPYAGLSFGIINANVRNIDGRTSSGYHTEMLSTHDYQVFSSFGIKPSPGFRVGATVKFNVADYHNEVKPSTALGMDLGMLFRADQPLRFSLTVRDLLATTRWNTSELYRNAGSTNVTEAWPRRVNFGVSYRATPDWIIGSEWEALIHTSSVTEREVSLDFGYPLTFERQKSITHTSYVFRVGTRYQLHERFILRMGYQNEDLKHPTDLQRISGGFSLLLPYDPLSPSIDYALIREPFGVSYLHAFALRITL
jgi:hypothetical protein